MTTPRAPLGRDPLPCPICKQEPKVRRYNSEVDRDTNDTYHCEPVACPMMDDSPGRMGFFLDAWNYRAANLAACIESARASGLSGAGEPTAFPDDAYMEQMEAHRDEGGTLTDLQCFYLNWWDREKQWRKKFAGVIDHSGAQAIRIGDLEVLIGQPPEGSHPDEQLPRSSTWHAERLNWIAEVDRLRAALSVREERAPSATDVLQERVEVLEGVLIEFLNENYHQLVGGKQAAEHAIAILSAHHKDAK